LERHNWESRETFERKLTILRPEFGYKVDRLKTRPLSSTTLTEHEYLSNSFRSYEGRSGLDLSFPFLCLMVSARRRHYVGNYRLIIRRFLRVGSEQGVRPQHMPQRGVWISRPHKSNQFEWLVGRHRQRSKSKT
jgi:hypothetical protein